MRGRRLVADEVCGFAGSKEGVEAGQGVRRGLGEGGEGGDLSREADGARGVEGDGGEGSLERLEWGIREEQRHG
jgi:hypothetical protein